MRGTGAGDDSTRRGTIAAEEHSSRQFLTGFPAAPETVRRPPLALVEAPPAQDERLSLSVLRSAADVAAIRDAWLELGGDGVDADPDYFLWSLDEEPHVVRPYVLVAQGQTGPAAIVAGRIVDVQLPCKLGRRTLFAPSVRALCVARGGVRGRLDAETEAAVLDELEAALERREADVVLFRQVEWTSSLHSALTRRASLLERRQHSARSHLRWQIDLPASLDEYLASLSPSTRKGARRTERRLEQELGGRLAVRSYTGPECLDEIETVAARTYQRQLGVGYLGDERQRARLTLLARRGWLRAFVLELDGQPIAFELGELYGRRFHSLAGGYDPEHGRLRVGGFLLVRAIGALAEDPAVDVFDFGFGDAPYKGKLGHRALVEGDVILYARRLRPQAVSAVRTALLGLSRMLTRSLDRLALLEAVRRRARRPSLYGSASACSPASSSTT